MKTIEYLDHIHEICSADYSLSCHPFINPIVNPADILPVNGIPKFVIANEAAADCPWSLLLLLIPGICIIRFVSVVSAPSDTC
jgi:hypothetical protein